MDEKDGATKAQLRKEKITTGIPVETSPGTDALGSVKLAKLFNAILSELKAEEAGARLKADLEMPNTARKLNHKLIKEAKAAIDDINRRVRSFDAELTKIEQLNGMPEGTLKDVKEKLAELSEQRQATNMPREAVEQRLKGMMREVKDKINSGVR